jgi:predicted GIY-YIG superfamily endonuclease
VTVPNELATIPAARPGKTALYRFLDADSRLLYVGITSNPERRWAAHRRYAARTWWHLTTRVTVEWFDERDKAAAAELRIIRTKAPLYNSGGAPSPLRNQVPGEKHCPKLGHSKLIREVGDRVWTHEHAHVAIADRLKSDISAGLLPPGSPMPSGAQLVGRFGVSIATVRRALGHLIDGGQVVRRGEGVRSRYFVAD